MVTPIVTLTRRQAAMVGKRFGIKTVIAFVELRGVKRTAFWKVRCDCGKEYETSSNSLLYKPAQSVDKCLCQRKVLHLKRTSIYTTWRSMHDRCTCPNRRDYKYYGGRGIKVDPRWKDIEVFIADMGPKPTPKHTIDRLDVNDPYSKGNCVWADNETQQNNKRSTLLLTFGGKTMSLAQWGRATGLGHALQGRLRLGWSLERAITEPLKTKRHSK